MFVDNFSLLIYYGHKLTQLHIAICRSCAI